MIIHRNTNMSCKVGRVLIASMVYVWLFVSSEGFIGINACRSKGLGLNYTLPMFNECKKTLYNGAMIHTVPKLIHSHFSASEGSCSGRKIRWGIPSGQRVCRIPDCIRNPCTHGWCEETVDGRTCHHSSPSEETSGMTTSGTTTGAGTTLEITAETRMKTTLDQGVTSGNASGLTKSTSVTTPGITTLAPEDIPPCKLDLHGHNYTGNLSRTLSGRICQNWASHTPHQQEHHHEGDHNHCRNPNEMGTAWCYTTDPEKKWEYCAVGLFDPECDPSSKGGNISLCWYDYNGLNYTGTLSQTLSGRTCQNWSFDDPHRHVYNHVGDHNYCRNPDQTVTAWCYTTDVNVRWEYCAVGIYHSDCADFTLKGNQ